MSAPRKRAGTAQTVSYAPVFSALGDETRLKLIGALCAGGPMSITRLTEGTRFTRQAVTKHLRVLAAVGLARDIRSGRERLWRFEPTPLDEARRSLDAIGAQWDRALLRLKASVEED